jgi:hypothetical protein
MRQSCKDLYCGAQNFLQKKSATAILQVFEVRREKMRREIFQFRVTCRSVGSRRFSYNCLKKFKDYETMQCLDTIKKFLEVIFNINTAKQKKNTFFTKSSNTPS